jgi:hypothetical protein
MRLRLLAVMLGGLATLAAPSAPACDAVVVWRTELSGAALAPPVQTDARGFASIDFRFGHRQATVNIDLQNIRDVTGIDLRAGDFQKPGPVLFTLYSHGDAPLSGSFSKNIGDKDLKHRSSVHVRSFDDALRAVVEGTAYVLVRTKSHKNGELMGRISMHKDVLFSETDAGGGHDARLHEQARAAQPAPVAD